MIRFDIRYRGEYLDAFITFSKSKIVKIIHLILGYCANAYLDAS